jgi:two-component system CheB/CheR fusion protein
MDEHSEPPESAQALRRKIIGLGERSFRKSHYPQLQERLADLQRFRELLDQSSDGIFVLEVPSGRFVDLNKCAYAELGYTRSEMLEMTIFGLVEPDTADRIAAVLEGAEGPEGEAQRITATLRRKDGRTIPVEIALRVATVADVQYGLGVARDISAFLRAQEELQRGKEEAEAADRAKSEFLNIASHELRTPLTSVSLLLQRLVGRHAQGAVLTGKDLERMKRQIDRLTRMVDELLSVARLEHGLVLAPQQLELRALAEESVESALAQAPDRAITLEAQGPGLVEADPVRINQVLGNLLDNALKYTPAGSPIEVKLTESPEAVTVAVADHGPGIPREGRRDLFSRFHRLKSDATIRQPGLGLGLFICREIIQAHGGTIGFDTQVGAGTTFYFTLPRTLGSKAGG